MQQNVVVLVGRILLALMFITAGYPKLIDPSGTAGMIAGAGLPAATALAYLAGLFELVAGLFVLVGFQTRIAAYLLAAFSAVTKLFYDLKAPKWAIWAFGAAFQMAHVQTGSYLVDQFCAYFVYFYSGYIFAPVIFRLVDWAVANKRLALLGLAVYAVVNAVLVFSPGFEVLPGEIQLGWGGFPGVRLLLAIAGALALCVTAGLITGFAAINWLRWLGEHSIVIYLVFVLPMSFARIALGKLGLIQDVTLSSFLVIVIAIATSVGLYLLVQTTGRAKFLFERPAWAHLNGVKGSRSYRPAAVPAE